MSFDTAEFIDRVAWEKMDSLVPAIVQNAQTGRVLMLGYMNRESLAATIDTGLVTFYSRSRKTLWCKGEISGNTLEFVSVSLDCDQDTLLVQANPAGPTCHLNTESCFDHETISSNTADAVTQSGSSSSSIGIGGFLGDLQSLIHERKNEVQSQGDSEEHSGYTQSLFASGVKRMAQKVGEEGVEVALAALADEIAAAGGNDEKQKAAREELLDESADLIYHLLVLLSSRDRDIADVVDVLKARRG